MADTDEQKRRNYEEYLKEAQRKEEERSELFKTRRNNLGKMRTLCEYCGSKVSRDSLRHHHK